MSAKKTQHDGATKERACWMRKVRALFRADTGNVSLENLLHFGEERVARFKKKKGGL